VRYAQRSLRAVQKGEDDDRVTSDALCAMGNASWTSTHSFPHVSSRARVCWHRSVDSTRSARRGPGRVHSEHSLHRSDALMSLDLMSLEEPRSIFPFAPGAGAAATPGVAVRCAKHSARVGEVITFAYPGQRTRRRTPNQGGTLVAVPRDALAKHQQEPRERPIYIAGNSKRSRVGCHVSLTDSVRRVICFGYPRVGRNGAKRDQVLRMRTPVLFMGVSSDVLYPFALLESVRERMTAANPICGINEGNHSLIVNAAALRRENTPQEITESYVISSIGEFIREQG
jgi:alpha/beta hydrolase family protein